MDAYNFEDRCCSVSNVGIANRNPCGKAALPCGEVCLPCIKMDYLRDCLYCDADDWLGWCGESLVSQIEGVELDRRSTDKNLHKSGIMKKMSFGCVVSILFFLVALMFGMIYMPAMKPAVLDVQCPFCGKPIVLHKEPCDSMKKDSVAAEQFVKTLQEAAK